VNPVPVTVIVVEPVAEANKVLFERLVIVCSVKLIVAVPTNAIPIAFATLILYGVCNGSKPLAAPNTPISKLIWYPAAAGVVVLKTLYRVPSAPSS
jgi:hypothetical protein